MPINIDPTGTLGDLIHDQSTGLTDDDVNIETSGVAGLETLSPTFYSLLVSTGLVTDNGDLTDTYAERVGVASSGTDWITVTGESDINTLRFASDSSGGLLDGDVWTDGGNVLTTDNTGEMIYLYAVEGGTLLVGSTLAPAHFGVGTPPTLLSDFEVGVGDYSNLVIAAYLDAETDFTSAEVYYTSFRPVVNTNTGAADADYRDLADNVWLFGDSSQVLTFSGLDPQKFLFGIAGADDPDGDANAKIFVLGENYMVDNDEEPVNGPAAQKLNTSSAGKFWQFPDLEDVATVGVHNQSVNADQGIFVMLMNTADPVGNYQDGDDADDLVSDSGAGEAILKQSQMGFGIVQAVGNQGIEIEITGYDSGFTSGADLVQSDDSSLGDAATLKGIESVTISWIDGDGGTVYTDTFMVGDTPPQQLDLNGRIVTLSFSGNDGSGNPTKITLSNVASQDLITVDWVEPVDHALLHTVTGAIDWGIVAGSFGNPFSDNIGEHMLYDDAGPTASVSVGTEPGVKYLFDGNYDVPTLTVGNYEGGNGTGFPTDDDPNPDGDNAVTVNFTGAFTTNHVYDTDGNNGLSTVYAWDGPTIGSAVMMVDNDDTTAQASSGGVDLIWATTTGGFAAVTDDVSVTEIFTITRDGASVTFTLKGPLDQPNADNDPITADILTLANGQIGLKRTDTITDGDGDTHDDDATVDLGGNFGVGDDEPIVNVMTDVDPGEIAALGVNLDETIDPDDDQIADGVDNYATGENESTSATDPGPYVPPAGNGDLDDVIVDDAANTPVYLEAPVGSIDADGNTPIADSQAIGRLESTAGQITALFTSASASTSFGADGEFGTSPGDGIDESLAFDLSLNGVATNLVATPVVNSDIEAWSPAERTVHLFAVADTDGDVTVIEGRITGPDGEDVGTEDDVYVILRMTLTNKDDPAKATIVYENFAPVQHPDTALQDDTIKLLIPESTGETPVQETLSVVYSVTAKDTDLDTDSDSKSVVLIDDEVTILEIDDDGPGGAGEGDLVELHEDALTPNGRPDGGTEQTTASGSLADQVNGGTDGVKGFGFTSDSSFTDDLDDLLHSSGGDDLVWSVTKDVATTTPAGGDVLTGVTDIGGVKIIEVIVYDDGTYDMTLFGPLDHDRGLDAQPDGDVIIIDFTDGLEAFEGDDDPVTFNANALSGQFEDDAPLAAFAANSAEPGVQYLYDGNFDHSNSYGNFEGNNDNAPPTADVTPTVDNPANGPNTVDVDFSGVFNPNHAFGADGAGSTTTSYTLKLGVADGTAVMMSSSAVTTGGNAVIWDEVDSTTIRAVDSTDATNIIFELSVNGSGVVTFKQTGVLDHPDAETDSLTDVYTDDILTLDTGQVSIRRTDDIEDADEDPSSDYAEADLGGNFGIGDDAPTADVDNDGTEPGVQYLYDGNYDIGGLATGNYEGSPDNDDPIADATPTADVTPDGPNTVTVNYSGAFTTDHDAGADGQKSSTPAYTLVLGEFLDGTAVKMTDGTGSTAVTSGGVDVVWDIVNATTIRAVTDDLSADVIFTISVVGGTGAVTFTQTGVLDHRREDTMSVYTSDIFTLDDGQISLRRTDTVIDNDDDEASDSADVDLGGNFGIGDDAPVITSAPDVPKLAFMSGTDTTVDGSIAYGADGAGSYIIKSATNPSVPAGSVLGVITNEIAADGQSITYSYDRDGAGTDFDPVDFYKITLSETDPGDYEAEVLAGPPLVKVNLLEGSTFPGGPIEEFTPTGVGSFVTFDGFIANDWDASEGTLLRGQFYGGGDRGELGEESEGFSDEDINIDSNGIGLENAIMNATEALAMFFDNPQAGVEIVFDGPTGGLKTFDIRIEAYFNDGAGSVTLVDSEQLPVTAPKGPRQTTIEWESTGGVFNELYVSLSIAGNDAIRIPEISTFTFAEIADLGATVTLELEDFDGDTDVDTFNWALDGDGDGV